MFHIAIFQMTAFLLHIGDHVADVTSVTSVALPDGHDGPLLPRLRSDLLEHDERPQHLGRDTPPACGAGTPDSTNGPHRGEAIPIHGGTWQGSEGSDPEHKTTGGLGLNAAPGRSLSPEVMTAVVPVMNYVCAREGVWHDGPTLVAADASVYTCTPSGLLGISCEDIIGDNPDLIHDICDIPLGVFLGALLALVLVPTVKAYIALYLPETYINLVLVPHLLYQGAVASFVPFEFLRRALRGVPAFVAIALFYMVSGVAAAPAVCGICGQADHVEADCPLSGNAVNTAIAKNVVAMAAGTYTAIETFKVLPSFLYHLFPLTAIQTLVALARRSKNAGSLFDFSKVNSEYDVYTAIEAGECTVDEAKKWVDREYLSVKDTPTQSNKEVRAEGRAILKMITEHYSKSRLAGPTTGMHTHGAYRYTLAKVQKHVMKNGSADMYVDTVGSSEEASTSKAESSVCKAEYMHPKTAAQFHEMLDHWELTLVVTGVANIVETKQFIYDVVHHPARTLDWSWMMAYCHFLAYLETVENNPDKGYTLSNVLKAGAHDLMKARAETLGKGSDVFGSLFATGAQAARAPRNDSAKVKGSPTSERPCHSWNNNQPCRPEDIVTAPDGTKRCSFRHGCGQELGKDANGKPKLFSNGKAFCFMDHRKCEGCRNPEFKKQ